MRLSKVICIRKSPRGIIGILLSLTVLTICGMFYSWRAGLVFATALFFTGFIEIRTSNFTATVLNTMWGIILAVLICYFPPVVMDNSFFLRMEIQSFALNVICAVIVIMAVYLVTAKWRTSVVLATLALLILWTINYYVYAFRGKELCIMDFRSLGTALSVANQYTLTVPAHMAYAWITWLWVSFAGYSLPQMRANKCVCSRVGTLCTMVALILLLHIWSGDMSVISWNKEGTCTRGYYLNFYLGIRDAKVDKPENYSLEILDQYADHYSREEPSGAQYPNIIVIMDESFADFDIIGQVNANRPITPFIDSLEENCIRGFALSSIYGGTTPNSEFELLSSHSMAFLPDGSVAYQQYIDQKIYTLAWLLQSYGYSCFATHPFVETGWSRHIIYPYLGFNDSTFQEDYPRKKLVRAYVSDREMFSYVLDRLDSAGDQPLFCFGITMQNHGGYEYEGDNYTQSIFLEGYRRVYPDVEQYLSLIHETDQAVEYLLTALESYPEDTVVLFFGDHFPQVDPEWYEELNGGPLDTLPERMKTYSVPFFIWTNYDIPEQTVELTSLNYLARYLLETAGIELPAYCRLLKEIEEMIPAINSQGFYSKSRGMFVSLEEATEEECKWLNIYQNLQYNNLFDKENRNEQFFAQYISTSSEK